MKLMMVVLKLLFLGALFIISNQNLHLGDDLERELFFENYYGWLDSLFDHGSEVTAFVVKFEWLPPKEDVQNSGEVLLPRVR